MTKRSGTDLYTIIVIVGAILALGGLGVSGIIVALGWIPAPP